MKVMYPLTVIRVAIPGSFPLMETWNPATPTEPVTLTHDSTDPSMRAIPQIMSSSTPTLTVLGAALGLGAPGGA